MLRNPEDNVHVAMLAATMDDIFGTDKAGDRDKEQLNGESSEDESKDDLSSFLSEQEKKAKQAKQDKATEAEPPSEPRPRRWLLTPNDRDPGLGDPGGRHARQRRDSRRPANVRFHRRARRAAKAAA